MTVKSHSSVPGRGLRSASAFTRADLLGLVMSLVLLAGLVLTSAGTSRGAAETMVCSANLRQLQRAMTLYTADQRDLYPYNFTIDALLGAGPQGPLPWAMNVMSWDTNPQNTNVTLLVRGSLTRYLAQPAPTFRCPTDRFLSPVQRNAKWRARVRSYSMNAFVGRSSLSANSLEASGQNPYAPNYRQYLRASDFSSPDQKFVLLEEHPDSINDGQFLNRPGAGSWIDLAASYHSRSVNLSFADGHTETHRWQLPATAAPVRYTYTLVNAGGSQAVDINWLLARTCEKLP